MKSRFGLWGFGLLIVTGCISISAGAEVAEIKVPVCATSPQLDAQLNDPCWKEAAMAAGFSLVGGGEVKPAKVQTTAWLCRDDTWLYLACRCDEPIAGSIRRFPAGRDGNVGISDSVEVFIDPGTAGKEYAHLILSAGNAQRDQWCRGKERTVAWDLPWRSAVQVGDTDKGWSAEMAIPLALLQERQGKEQWRINVGRNRQAVSPTEYSSLAPLPVGSGFHASQYFLVANGLTGFRAKVPLGPMLVGTKVQPLKVADGKYSYDLEINVRNLTTQTGMVELVAQDLPRAGRGEQVAQVVELGPRENKSVALTIPVTGPALRAAWVGLREPGSGFWLAKADVKDMEALAPFDAYLDRNYYTTEKEARVYAEMRVDQAERVKAGLSLQAEIIGGKSKIFARGAAACRGDIVSIPLALGEVPVGSHPVQLTLLDGKQNSLGTVELTLAKPAPAPAGANEVKIDRYNRCLLLNGQPFFGLGAYGLCIHGRVAGWQKEVFEAQYGYCREAGLNFVCDWKGYDGSAAGLDDRRADYDLADKYGLKVVGLPWVENIYRYFGKPELREKAMQVITAMDPYLAMCRTHPAVIGYYHWDEARAVMQMDDLLEAYTRKIHSLDPYHLVYLSQDSYAHQPEWGWFDTIADILQTHQYWHVMEGRGLKPYVGYWDMLDWRSRRAHSPTAAAPQLDNWHGFMLPDEQRAQTYLVLTRGARSIMYFALPFQHQTSVAVQKEISAEIQQLAPALLSREPGQEVTFEPEGAAIIFPLARVNLAGPDKRYPLVQVALRNHPAMGPVLLAVNPAPEPVTTRFAVSSLAAKSTVQRLFGDKRAHPVTAGAFTDMLEPFATRAYLLSNTPVAEGESIRIHLAMSGPAVESAIKENAEPKPAAKPAEGLQKNLVLNSSFEQSRMPGYPDCWNSFVFKYLVPDERAVGLDARNPWHGKYAFRLVRPYPNDTAVFGKAVALKPESTYTFSCYLRADQTNTPAMLCFHTARQNVVAGAEWKRYSQTVTIPPGKDVQAAIGIFHLGEAGRGNLYVDAVQVEEGTQPTEYAGN